MKFETRRDYRVSILYFLVFGTTIIFSYLLIKGIITGASIRDVFLDVIGLVLVLFVAFMAFTVYTINYYYFDLESNELCSKAGLGVLERYKFKHVLSCQRRRKLLVTSALAIDVFEIVIERSKAEGKIILYASPKDEAGFLAALKENCRNVRFLDKK